LDESDDLIEFQATDEYGMNLGHARVVYKTQRLSAVEKEDVIYRIKARISKP
jgi:hypothetical protein